MPEDSHVSRQADIRKPSWPQGKAQPVCIKVPLPARHQYDILYEDDSKTVAAIIF